MFEKFRNDDPADEERIKAAGEEALKELKDDAAVDKEINDVEKKYYDNLEREAKDDYNTAEANVTMELSESVNAIRYLKHFRAAYPDVVTDNMTIAEFERFLGERMREDLSLLNPGPENVKERGEQA